MTLDIVMIVSLVALALAAGLLAISLRRVPIAWGVEKKQLLQRMSELEAVVGVLQRTLAHKDHEIGRLKERVRHLEAEAAVAPINIGNRIDVLLVGVGRDSETRLDLAVLRGIRSNRLRLTRLQPVSIQNLTRALDAARARDKPIRFVHLAVPTNERGVQFDDGPQTWEDLSAVLGDVTVLAVMGSYSDAAGALLAGGMRVVSFREQVSAIDASNFAQQFWRALIEEDKSADEAFDQATRRVRQAGEYAELH